MRHLTYKQKAYTVLIVILTVFLCILFHSSESYQCNVSIEGQRVEIDNSGWTSSLLENPIVMEWGESIELNLSGEKWDNVSVYIEKALIFPDGSPNLNSIQEIEVSEHNGDVLCIEHSPWPKLWQAGLVQYIGYHLTLDFTDSTHEFYFVVESSMKGNMLNYLEDSLTEELDSEPLSSIQETTVLNHVPRKISLVVTKHLLPVLCVDEEPVLVFSHNNGTLYEDSELLAIDLSGDGLAELLVLSHDSSQLLVQGGYLSNNEWKELEVDLGEIYLKLSTQNENNYSLYHVQNGAEELIQTIQLDTGYAPPDFSEERLTFTLLPNYKIEAAGNTEKLYLTAKVYISALEKELLLDCYVHQSGNKLTCSFTNF